MIVRVEMLVNTRNYENIRFISSEFDDVELCYQEPSDAMSRLKMAEIQIYRDSILETRDYKEKLGVFNHRKLLLELKIIDVIKQLENKIAGEGK